MTSDYRRNRISIRRYYGNDEVIDYTADAEADKITLKSVIISFFGMSPHNFSKGNPKNQMKRYDGDDINLRRDFTRGFVNEDSMMKNKS